MWMLLSKPHRISKAEHQGDANYIVVMGRKGNDFQKMWFGRVSQFSPHP